MTTPTTMTTRAIRALLNELGLTSECHVTRGRGEQIVIWYGALRVDPVTGALSADYEKINATQNVLSPILDPVYAVRWENDRCTLLCLAVPTE